MSNKNRVPVKLPKTDCSHRTRIVKYKSKKIFIYLI